MLPASTHSENYEIDFLRQARVTETPDSSTIRVASSVADIDENVLARIKKCLDRAYHANAAEAEAKAALHLASRLMNQYNVSQAEVLAHEPPDVQRQYGGRSCVSITRRDGDLTKAVQQSTFVGDLCLAIQTFFDTQSYTSKGSSSVTVVFYGVAQNTATAAHAFEMVFNLMLEWARPYAGRNGKNSYCVGISSGLLRLANEEKTKEEADAKKAEEDAIAARIKEEEAQRHAELSRLADFPLDTEQDTNEADVRVAQDLAEDVDDDNSSTTSSISWCPSWASITKDDDVSDQQDLIKEEYLDDEADEMNVDADFSDNFIDLTGDDNADIDSLMNMFIPRANRDRHLPLRQPDTSALGDAPKKNIKKDSVEPTNTSSKQDEEQKWQSHSQLILFRDTAKKIAEDYIKDQGLNIRKKKARKFDIDRSAYKQGQKDSKKIDVRGKTIKDTAGEETKEDPSYVSTD